MRDRPTIQIDLMGMRPFTSYLEKDMRFLGILCATGIAALAPLAAEDIQIAGSTTVQPIMAAVAKTFQDAHPGIILTVKAGGSDIGISLAGAGKINLGMVSRPLNDDDLKAYPDLVDTAIGSDGLVFVVPAAVTVTAITSEQIRDIYTGATTNWQNLGGGNLAIVPVGRDSRHGTAKVFADFFKLEATEEFLGAAPMIHERRSGSATPGSVVVQVTSSNDETLQAVSDHPGGIGYCSAAVAEGAIAAGEKLHILSLDSVPGSSATIRDGTYPVRRPLLLVTRGKPTGTIKAIIDFVLSPAGQDLVGKSEFIPLGATPKP